MGLVHLNKSPQALLVVVCIVALCLAGCNPVAAQASKTTSSVTSAWPPFKFSRFEYIFIPRAESWQSAQDLCESRYNASLASIHSQEEQNFLLKTFVETQDPTKFPILVPASIYPGNDGVSHRGIWIGLRTDIKVGGSWSDNTTIDYLNWIEKKPDNYKAQEGCTQIYVDNDQEGWYGMWDDLSCDSAMPFICKRLVGLNKTNPAIMYEGFDYILHYESQPVVEAEKTCQKVDNGHLTSIASEAELTFLMGAFVGGQLATDFEAKMPAVYPVGYQLEGIYVGLVKLNSSLWAWLDGNHSAFTAWGPSLPDNFANVTENCAHLWVNEEPTDQFGSLNDVNCKTSMPFICKRPATGNATAWLETNDAPAPPLDLNSTAAQLAADAGLGLQDNGAPRKSNTTRVAVICGVIGGVVGMGILCCVVCRLRRRRPKKKKDLENDDPELEIETMHLTPPNSQLFSHQDPRNATPQQMYAQPLPASRQPPQQYPSPNGTPPQQQNGHARGGPVQRALPPGQRPPQGPPPGPGPGPSSSYTHQRPPPAPMQRARPRT